jgi:hypothetical protein
MRFVSLVRGGLAYPLQPPPLALLACKSDPEWEFEWSTGWPQNFR